MLGLGLALTTVSVLAIAASAPPPPTPTIVTTTIDGDSFSAKTSGTQSQSGAWPDRWAVTQPGVSVTNLAVGGGGLGYPSDGPTENTLWGRAPQVIALQPQLHVVLIGPNDLPTASGPYLTRIWEYVAYIRANVPGVIIVWGLIQPRGSSAPFNTQFNADRALINAALRAAVGNQIDAIIAFGEDPDIGPDAAGDDTSKYAADGASHPTAETQRLMAIKAGAVLDPIVAKRIGSTNLSYVFPDVLNAPASGTVTRRGTVTGLGLGQVAIITPSGTGTMAANLSAFGTTGRAVMNGDVLGGQDTASAIANTIRDTVVSGPGFSDTFRVQTVSASPPVFTSYAALRLTGGTMTGTLELGAGLPMLAFDKNGAHVTSVSVTRSGVTTIFDKVVEAQPTGQDYSIWVGRAAVVAGANYVVTVVSGGANDETSIFPATCSGVTTAGAASKLGFGSRGAIWNAGAQAVPDTMGQLAHGAKRVMFCFAPEDTTFPDGTLERTYSDNRRWVTWSNTFRPQMRAGADGGTFLLAFDLNP